MSMNLRKCDEHNKIIRKRHRLTGRRSKLDGGENEQGARG